METQLICAVCSTPLTPPQRGPTPTYCSSTCRKRASRIRQAQAGPTTRIIPARAPARLPKPTRDDIARLLLELHGIEAGLRRAAAHCDEFRFRPMCSRIADAIRAAVDAEMSEEG
jgi:hypothetical protein